MGRVGGARNCCSRRGRARPPWSQHVDAARDDAPDLERLAVCCGRARVRARSPRRSRSSRPKRGRWASAMRTLTPSLWRTTQCVATAAAVDHLRRLSPGKCGAQGGQRSGMRAAECRGSRCVRALGRGRLRDCRGSEPSQQAGEKYEAMRRRILRDALRWSAPQDAVHYFNGLPHPEQAPTGPRPARPEDRLRAVSKGADRGKPLFSASRQVCAGGVSGSWKAPPQYFARQSKLATGLRRSIGLRGPWITCGLQRFARSRIVVARLC